VNLKGIFPPVTTPFDSAGDVAYEKLKENLVSWNKTGLAGYTILGSTGESIYLMEEEKLRIVEAARDAIPNTKHMMVGVIYESTRHAVDFVKAAARVGADSVLVGAPNYYKERMKDEVLFAHYTRVAESATIPVLLYNVPQFTGVSLSPSLVARLSLHENIIGIKDSSGHIIGLSEIVRLAQPGFQVLTGSAPALFPSLCLGAVGAVLAIACAAPEATVELYNIFVGGDLARARELQFRLAPAMFMTTTYGIAGLKAAMDMMGYYGGDCRLPLLPLNESAKVEIKAVFRKAGLL
jgi:4-hydroxy-2-oxoglutarate aldolase